MAHFLLAGLASHATQLPEAQQAFGSLVHILPIIPFFPFFFLLLAFVWQASLGFL